MSSRRFVAPKVDGQDSPQADPSLARDVPILPPRRSLIPEDEIPTGTGIVESTSDSPNVQLPTVQPSAQPSTAPPPLDPDQAFYLNQLGKHGHNLRVKHQVHPRNTPNVPRSHPLPSDHLRKKSPGEDSKSSLDGSNTDQVDWFGYWLAVIQYRLSSPDAPPLPPHEPFTVQRLRSSGERLYVAARPPWEAFASMSGDVIMWEDWKRTVWWMVVYTTLVITSRFLVFFHLVLVYYLVRGRFPERESSADPHLEDDAEALVDAVMPPDILTDEEVAVGLASMAMDEMNSRKDKQPKEKRRLRKKWERFQTEHGKGAVVVLNDLADMHEKVANLFTWKDPSVSFWFALILLGSAAVTLHIPTPILLKLGQVGFGVLVFLVIPAAARQAQYDPLSWLFGSAPTNTEYAVRILRQRMAAGAPLSIAEMVEADDAPVVTTTSTTAVTTTSQTTGPVDNLPNKARSDWTKMKDLAIKTRDNSHKWLEVGRSIRSGETEVRLSGLLGTTTTREDEAGDPSVKHLRLKGGPGITLRSRSNDTDSQTSFMARHEGRLGTLFISARGIRFAALNTGKLKKGVHDEGDIDLASDTATLTSLPASDIKIAMEDIVGICKTDRRAVKLKVISGLSFQTADGTDLILPFVSYRDDAFLLFLASSQSPFLAV